jgi:hypothetical protein
MPLTILGIDPVFPIFLVEIEGNKPSIGPMYTLIPIGKRFYGHMCITDFRLYKVYEMD